MKDEKDKLEKLLSKKVHVRYGDESGIGEYTGRMVEIDKDFITLKIEGTDEPIVVRKTSIISIELKG